MNEKLADCLFKKKNNWFTLNEISNELSVETPVLNIFKNLIDNNILVKQGTKYLLKRFI